jgi:hypothetical protein
MGLLSVGTCGVSTPLRRAEGYVQYMSILSMIAATPYTSSSRRSRIDYPKKAAICRFRSERLADSCLFATPNDRDREVHEANAANVVTPTMDHSCPSKALGERRVIQLQASKLDDRFWSPGRLLQFEAR